MARSPRKPPMNHPTPLEATPGQPGQAELWSPEPAPFTPRPPSPPPHVSMPLGDYRVERLPAIPLGDEATVTTEHIVCKQPLRSTQTLLAD